MGVPKSKTDRNTDEKDIDPKIEESGIELANDTDLRSPLLLSVASVGAFEVSVVHLGPVVRDEALA